MKLRNKKTGEIWTLTNRNEGTSAVLWVSNGSQTHVIESIEELANNFEDYEEPKKYWFISPIDIDVVETEKMEGDEVDEFNKQIGNYFETKAEAEEAVEKLKAWKRLKDKGFTFRHLKRYLLTDGGVDIRLSKSEYWEDEQVQADLDLLFGGEE